MRWTFLAAMLVAAAILFPACNKKSSSGGAWPASAPNPAFVTGSPYAAGNGAVSVAKGDFNRDGETDLAVVNLVDGDVSIRLGNGLGGFTSAAMSRSGQAPPGRWPPISTTTAMTIWWWSTWAATTSPS